MKMEREENRPASRCWQFGAAFPNAAGVESMTHERIKDFQANGCVPEISEYNFITLKNLEGWNVGFSFVPLSF